MKRISTVAALLLILFASQVFAAGSCVQTGATEQVRLTPGGDVERKYVTLTCTGDGTIAAYSFNPSASAFAVKGWYLYNISTNPGASAPTDLYDITLVVDGEDIAGGLMNNRSTSATETVVIAPTGKGYHMTDQTMAITFANETASPSTIVMKLRFTRN